MSDADFPRCAAVALDDEVAGVRDSLAKSSSEQTEALGALKATVEGKLSSRLEECKPPPPFPNWRTERVDIRPRRREALSQLEHEGMWSTCPLEGGYD